MMTSKEICKDCDNIEMARKENFCKKSLTCGYYVPLKGEGETRTLTQISKRYECEICDAPADYRCTFLLENARSNPGSQGFRGDDISWCSDRELFACEQHKKEVWKDHCGYSICACFPLEKFPHMGLHWVEVKDK